MEYGRQKKSGRILMFSATAKKRKQTDILFNQEFIKNMKKRLPAGFNPTAGSRLFNEPESVYYSHRWRPK